MKKESSHSPRQINSVVLIIVFTILTIYSCAAQCKQRISYMGFEYSTGTHRFYLDNYTLKPGNINALTKGLSGGVYFGNNLVNLRLRTGYYFSSRNIKHELGVVEFDALLDFYPLEFIRTRNNILDVYLTMGYSHNRFKQDAPVKSNRVVDELLENLPKNGNYQVGGLGLKFIPPVGRKRTYFFAEVLFYNPMNASQEDINVCTNIGFKRRFQIKVLK